MEKKRNLSSQLSAFFQMNITKHQILFCSAYIPLNNYLVFNDVDGLYSYTFEAERKVCCSLIVLSCNHH